MDNTNEIKEKVKVSGFQLMNISTQNVSADLFNKIIESAISGDDDEVQATEVLQYRKKRKNSHGEKIKIPFLLRHKLGKNRVSLKDRYFTVPFGFSKSLVESSMKLYEN